MIEHFNLHNQLVEKPFFSVCIETKDRGETIFRALESIAHQSFRNFECVIVDNCSKDKTIHEIQRFIESTSYKAKPFAIQLYQNKNQISELENWNSPLKMAKGNYIAILEGDDTFANINHLQNAFSVLTSTENIGVYATGSQRAKRPWSGWKSAQDYFLFNYKIENVSPPSETIFIRKNKNEEPYFFDSINNEYAPELQLWLQIANDGFDAYHTDTQDIYREPGTGSTSYKWKFFKDKFYILSTFKNHKWVTEKHFNSSVKHQAIQVLRRYVIGKSDSKPMADEILTEFKKLEISKSFQFHLILVNIIVNLNLYKIYRKLK
ncbi:MAG: hypothetical protein RIQ33_1420 [Bacteroidota bacterium]|jgi:glycosyltransferase involved in cell wall biosynthesis